MCRHAFVRTGSSNLLRGAASLRHPMLANKFLFGEKLSQQNAH